MGIIEDPEQQILDCYRLAQIYHQSPNVFLDMPLYEVRMHLMRTAQMREIQQQSAMPPDDETTFR